MGQLKKAVLFVVFAAIGAVTAASLTMSAEDEKMEGKVVHTNLTLCHPRPTGGGCEGTLTLETKTGGTTQQVAIKVMADTIIKKGQDYLLLPQTQDNSVV